MAGELQVAPNAPNTLVIDVTRLPLGRKIRAQAGLTLWRVYIPSYFGGVLTIRHTSSMSVLIDRPIGQTLAFGIRQATYTIAPSLFGDYFVTALGDAGEIVAEFTQTFWSRKTPDPTSEPLLPYNFFYWPSARSSLYAKEAIEILKRYAKATGKSEADAATFEHDEHQFPDADQWAGHCHNAAPASGLFEQPKAMVIRGQTFDQEAMEFLATEFFGTFGREGGTPWALLSSSKHPIGRWDVLAWISTDREWLTPARSGGALAP